MRKGIDLVSRAILKQPEQAERKPRINDDALLYNRESLCFIFLLDRISIIRFLQTFTNEKPVAICDRLPAA
jgi:hypothetical protein